MSKKLFACACLLFIGAGVIMRFAFLFVPYEYDELFTAVTANPALPLSWIWTHWLLVDVHPPLHNVLLWAYNHVAPYGPEVWLRLPSVACGLAVLALGWCMFPRRFGKTARWLFMALLTGNFYVTFYSQHARAYALMLALSVPLTFLFLQISLLLRKGRAVPRKLWLWWGALLVLLGWSHYFGMLFFGITSGLLAVQALHSRKNIAWALLLPCVVFACFLPWLVPNLLYNVGQNRFGGNWWADKTPGIFVWGGLISYFFAYTAAFLVLGVLVLSGWVWNYEDFKCKRRFPFQRELLLLLALLAGVFGFVGLLYFKIYLWFGRYFMEIMPALFLFVALSAARVVRHSWVAKLIFVVYLGMIGVRTASYWRLIVYSHYFPSRISAQFYRDHAPEKELFVIAVEAFPPQALEPMYSFYPNQVYHMNARVTELYHLDEAARDEALKRRAGALIWMPNCDIVKLSRVSKEWNRAIALEGKLGNSCFLQLSDKNVEADPAWNKRKIEWEDLAH